MDDADWDHVVERSSTYGFGSSPVCRYAAPKTTPRRNPAATVASLLAARMKREVPSLERTAFDRPLRARRERALLRGVDPAPSLKLT
jgi:hypothetical protein